jgi:hypothetical protein
VIIHTIAVWCVIASRLARQEVALRAIAPTSADFYTHDSRHASCSSCVTMMIEQARTSSEVVREWFEGERVRLMPTSQKPDLILLWTTPANRAELMELVQAHGYELRLPTTPLHAVEILVDVGHRVSHALLSRKLPHGWGAELHSYLLDEYPSIHCMMLDTF